MWANFHSSKFPCICVTVSHGLPGMVARVSHGKPKCLHRRERVPCSAAWHASNPILPRISFNGNQMPYMFPIPSFLQLLVQHSHLQATPFHMPPSTLLKTLTNALPNSASLGSPNQARKREPFARKLNFFDLDDAKEDVDLLKIVGHWRDHWVIQLITIRGWMQNTFSAPPKQGIRLPSLIFLGFFCKFFVGFREDLSPTYFTIFVNLRLPQV